MKTRYKILIITAIIIIGFVIWSLVDLVCMPCKIPPDAPENMRCVDSCTLEPRWYDWFR